MPIQPSSVNQLNYLFRPTTAEIQQSAQSPETQVETTTAQTSATPIKNVFEQLPWLDEALFWLAGILSDRIAKFVPQLVRKFIFGRDIA